MSIFFSLLSGLLGSLLVSITSTKMPDSEIVMVEYTKSGTMAGYLYYGKVERQDDGTVVIEAMQENYGEIIKKKVDPQVLTDLKTIVKEHKIYAYKGYYRPHFEVLDGYTWSLTIRFANGQSIDSGGSNAYPSGDGLSAIRELFIELVTDKPIN